MVALRRLGVVAYKGNSNSATETTGTGKQKARLPEPWTGLPAAQAEEA